MALSLIIFIVALLQFNLCSAQIDYTKPPANYSDGYFTQPDNYTSYTLGSRMNIAWTSNFKNVNLFIVQGQEFGSSVSIRSNFPGSSLDWQVQTATSDLSEPFTFRIVDADGDQEAQANGGFLSWYFEIKASDSTTTTTATATALPTTLSTTSAASPTQAAPTSSNTSPSSSTAEKKSNTGLAVGLGVGIGIPLIVVCAVLLVCFRRRSRAKSSESLQPMALSQKYQPNDVPPTYSHIAPVAPETGKHSGPIAELESYNGHRQAEDGPAELAGEPIVHEIGGPRSPR